MKYEMCDNCKKHVAVTWIANQHVCDDCYDEIERFYDEVIEKEQFGRDE